VSSNASVGACDAESVISAGGDEAQETTSGRPPLPEEPEKSTV